MSLGLIARPRKPQPTIGKNTTSTRIQSPNPSIRALRGLRLWRKSGTNATAQNVT